MNRYELGGIIVGGALHSENNQIGDKGVPVISRNFFEQGGYNKKHKTAEIERGEILFNKETAVKIERLINEYTSCGCQGKLLLLGKLVKEALRNTQDKQCELNDICEIDINLKKIK
jgi:hypothetical protein